MEGKNGEFQLRNYWNNKNKNVNLGGANGDGRRGRDGTSRTQCLTSNMVLTSDILHGIKMTNVWQNFY
jgi:hypothetical protein